MTSTRCVAILLYLTSWALPLPAQDTATGPMVQIIPGLQYDVLTRYTASLWIVGETSIRDYDEARLSHGVSLCLDAGTSGGKLLAGWANLGGIGGGSFSLGLLRTWNESRLAPNQTFLGAEIRGNFSALGVGAGYYQRVHGTGLGRRRSLDLSLAIWFRL